MCVLFRNKDLNFLRNEPPVGGTLLRTPQETNTHGPLLLEC